jgi:hypothetical protein
VHIHQDPPWWTELTMQQLLMYTVMALAAIAILYILITAGSQTGNVSPFPSPVR